MKGKKIMNNIQLSGKVMEMPVIKTNENGNTYANVTIAAKRTFKNFQGGYETDIVIIRFWKRMAEELCEELTDGAYLEIKGRIQSMANEHNGVTYYNYMIVGESFNIVLP